jgi:hypothetical protein
MLNDFINLKFPDTTGLLTNMNYNPLTQNKIVSRRLTSIPVSPTTGDIYIVNGSEGIDFLGNNWNEYINYFSRWDGSRWVFSPPTTNDFIEIDNRYDITDPDQGKRFIYTGNIWFEPIFNIPLNISMRIRQDPTVTSSTTTLVETIRQTLVESMYSKFGMDKNIDRSEIIKIVRSVSGVQYVELLEPQVDIKFNYTLGDLTEEQLLDYTPQLVAMTEDTISIKVIS